MSSIIDDENAWKKRQEAGGPPDHPGFRMKNLTTDQRDALSEAGARAAPKPGDIIFNTSTSTFQGWDGSDWVDFSAPAASAVTFVPGETGLVATNVQDAIEALVALIEA